MIDLSLEHFESWVAHSGNAADVAAGKYGVIIVNENGDEFVPALISEAAFSNYHLVETGDPENEWVIEANKGLSSARPYVSLKA